MIHFLQYIIATIILCPLLAFLIVFVSCRKMRMEQHKVIGLAADVTTIILFFSVPVAIQALWELSLFIPIYLLALSIAVIFTYIDWKKKKEIQVMLLLKKIWRAYFLLLGTSYFFVWVIGLVHSVTIYMVVI
ncbi:hypothetical protein CSE16_03895 [Solibacillus sp. R5-41]|uniref:DUF3397 domain-containing protein n=1 Tax=Solibacillus sp. R5-41 TaxID=2048654 RepID=UPI000C127839|nr:DUF3397 domain-containing protein [Solibacillus sp. R5-41]ATP39246.1 hypothetical protein CSE16_03895 [Solibacillus sp. R5-41]